MPPRPTRRPSFVCQPIACAVPASLAPQVQTDSQGRTWRRVNSTVGLLWHCTDSAGALAVPAAVRLHQGRYYALDLARGAAVLGAHHTLADAVEQAAQVQAPGVRKAR